MGEYREVANQKGAKEEQEVVVRRVEKRCDKGSPSPCSQLVEDTIKEEVARHRADWKK